MQHRFVGSPLVATDILITSLRLTNSLPNHCIGVHRLEIQVDLLSLSDEQQPEHRIWQCKTSY